MFELVGKVQSQCSGHKVTLQCCHHIHHCTSNFFPSQLIVLLFFLIDSTILFFCVLTLFLQKHFTHSTAMSTLFADLYKPVSKLVEDNFNSDKTKFNVKTKANDELVIIYLPKIYIFLYYRTLNWRLTRVKRVWMVNSLGSKFSSKTRQNTLSLVNWMSRAPWLPPPKLKTWRMVSLYAKK